MYRQGFGSLSIIVASALVVLAIAGIWYYKADQSKVSPSSSQNVQVSTDSGAPTPSYSENTSTSPGATSSAGSEVVPAPLISFTASVKTYNDPSGGFSFEYPGNFIVNNKAGRGTNSYLSQEIVEADAPNKEAGWIVPSLDANLQSINVTYGATEGVSNCEDLSYGSIASTTINGLTWYETIVGPGDSSYDEYQSYHNGACWGVEFDWALSDLSGDVSTFENSLLGTLQFNS